MVDNLGEKIFNGVGCVVRGALLSAFGLALYGAGALFSNINVTTNNNFLNYNESKQIIYNEQKKSRNLSKKTINLSNFSEEEFNGKYIHACVYSSEGEFNIMMLGDSIRRKELLHEIGHVKFSRPIKEEISRQQVIESLLGMEGDTTLKSVRNYLLDFEEFRCNRYAIRRDKKYIQGKE